MDEELRRLERQVASGDTTALDQLKAVRRRLALCPDCGKPKTTSPFAIEMGIDCLECNPLQNGWDAYEMIKNQAEALQEEEEDLSDDEAFNTASQYDYQHEWEAMAYELGSWVEELNPYEADWLTDFAGAGWQHRSGNATIEWNTNGITEVSKSFSYYREVGNKFLRSVLPNTDCTFTITYDGESIHIVNSHHDASGEVYHLVPGISCDHCDELHSTQEEADSCCYLCEHCEENYPTEQEAKNCCFACPHCISVTHWGSEIPTLYKAKEEAEDCCRDAPKCSTCDSSWDSPEEAATCCED